MYNDNLFIKIRNNPLENYFIIIYKKKNMIPSNFNNSSNNDLNNQLQTNHAFVQPNISTQSHKHDLIPNNPKIAFYHNYILKDLGRLQQRAHKYLQRRFDYITQKFEPLQKKVEQMRVQIRHFQNIRDYNDELVQGREDIKRLRKDIAKYRQSQQFYQKIVDQNQRMLFENEQKNNRMRQYIQNMKTQLVRIKKTYILQQVTQKKNPKHYTQTANINHLNDSNHIQRNLSIQSKNKSIKLNVSFSPNPSLNLPNLHSHKYKLPILNSSAKQVTANSKNLTSFAEQSQSHNNPAVISQLKQQLQLYVCTFNSLDSLFKDCFQSRKLTIQRMIGQLQSKLVKNKKIFVKACQAINTKDKQKLSFEQFKELDSDQIFTLLISFPTLGKKFTGQIQKKRQQIAHCSILIK